MNIVPTKVAEHAKRIEKRINDEPGFQVHKVGQFSDSPCPVFYMDVGRIVVFHAINVTATLPHPDDVVAALRDEYEYAFD